MIEGKANYTVIIDVPNKSKEDIYKAVKDWGVESFKTASALETDDKESGFITYRGYFKTYQVLDKDKPTENLAWLAIYDTWYKVKFYLKDHKVKVVITDIVFDDSYDRNIKYPLESYTAEYTALRSRKNKPDNNAKAEKAAYNCLLFAHTHFEALIKSISTKLAKKSEFEF